MTTPIDGSGKRLGRIEIISGSMFSGKTEELIRRLIRAKIAKQNVLVFKANLDDRYDKVDIRSHSGMSLRSQPISITEDGVKEVRRVVDEHNRTKGPVHVIGIDEIHFFHDSIVDLCDQYADQGIRVVAAGLDLDFSDEPFEPMKRLLAKAEYISKLQAICNQCGADGSKTFLKAKKVSDPKAPLIGGLDLYEARCRNCFQRPEVVDQEVTHDRKIRKKDSRKKSK